MPGCGQSGRMEKQRCRRLHAGTGTVLSASERDQPKNSRPTKGALEAFSRNTAREWGVRGIRSNCIVAGFMETDMSSSLTEEQKNRIYKRTSLKRATDIDSVAEMVKFLLSGKASSITGQNVHVDSGTI